MFEWDEEKSAANLIKHGISFEEAILIFDGDILSWIDGRLDYGETRTISIGLIRGLVAVAVVHTDRNGTTRIISARLASRRERKLYNDHR
ncbi:BrnT family toxin [Roseomonas frigidaquae]|uniref:BrnT family toxin n=1 Tax=Falsiroseomonas frigidaquae TaxID=487318 RepID=A0ABX1F967_9PROT|nr:BrnT family toxin [Falsiroseomonas frigidaquae]NKE48766.1 BrnT family toxin [Falsiroseomonas frigidaquae]